MSIRFVARFTSALTIALLTTATATAYIHFPPMTLPKMCRESHHIRVLKVETFDKKKGVVVFGDGETLKDGKSQITTHKLIVRPEATGAKPVLDWLKEGKTAVMFSIEGKDRAARRAIAYVFIDEYCFSADYNSEGRYWLLLRGEPGMSACYHGPAERLREAVKDTLAGKDVKVPVKEPKAQADREQRNGEINDALQKNRGSKP